MRCESNAVEANLGRLPSKIFNVTDPNAGHGISYRPLDRYIEPPQQSAKILKSLDWTPVSVLILPGWER